MLTAFVAFVALETGLSLAMAQLFVAFIIAFAGWQLGFLTARVWQ